jgi:hypothetical protein
MVCFGVSSGFKSLMLDDIFEKLALQIFWLLSKVGQFFIQTHPGCGPRHWMITKI